MRISFFLAIGGIGLLPSLASATNSTNFTLKTTEDLYTVCSTANSDPLRAEAINFCEGYLLGGVSYGDAIAYRKHLHRLICRLLRPPWWLTRGRRKPGQMSGRRDIWCARVRRGTLALRDCSIC